MDYAAYLMRQGISATAYVDGPQRVQRLGKVQRNPLVSLSISMKNSLSQVIDQTTVAPFRQILSGLLLGEGNAIPQSIKEDFKRSGVYHILAISGLHIGIISILIFAIMKMVGLGEEVATPLVLAFLLVYVCAIGWKWSAVRAAIMVATGLVARLIKREKDVVTSIALAAFIILIIWPLALFDVGFQLSFIATLSIVELVPLLLEILSPKKGGAVVTALAISLSAQIGTIPLQAYYFNQVSLISPIANLFIVPLVTVVVQLGFIAGVLGNLVLGVGAAINATNMVLLSIILRLAHLFGALPMAYCYVGSPSIPFLVIYYSLLIWICAGKRYPQIFRKREMVLKKRSTFALLFILAFIIWGQVFRVLSPALIVTFLDVGQGDAMVIEVPGGGTFLIDGGNREGSGDDIYDIGEKVVIPFLRSQGIRKLDLIILSHPHGDHVGGLGAVLEAFPVGRILEYGGPYDTSEKVPGVYHRFREIAKEKGIPRITIKEGHSILMGQNFRIDILHPGGMALPKSAGFNDYSLLLRMVYGQSTFLFTGDLERLGEDAVLKGGAELESQVLKVAHHGGNSSTSMEFLRKVRPEYGIISVGPNPFGHPSGGTLARLSYENVKVYRTDISGAITIKSDGKTLKIRTQEGY